MRPKYFGRVLRCGLPAVVALLVLLAHLSLVFNQPLSYDEAFNLQVPLNLHLNGRYQSWYGSLIQFNHRITTGPPVLLPVAGAFAVFGPTYWAGRLVMAAFCILYLTSLHAISRQLAPRRPWFLFVTATLLFVFVPSTLPLSAEVMGDIPSVAFFLLAVALMNTALRRRRDLAAAASGVALGLAILSKLVLLLAVPGFLLAIPLSSQLAGRRRAAWRPGLFCLAGILLPGLAWHAAKLLVLGRLGYVDNLAATRRMLVSGGSGLDLAAFSGGRGFGAHLTTLATALGTPGWVVVIGFLLIIACAVWMFALYERPFAAWSVLLPTAVHLAWWFFLSSWVWYHHLMPGYLMYPVLLAVLLSTIVGQAGVSCWARAGLVVACLMGICCTVPPRVPEWALVRSAALQAQEHGASAARATLAREPEATLWGYAWSQSPQVSFFARVPFHDLTHEAPNSARANYLVITRFMGQITSDLAPYAAAYCTREIFREGDVSLCLLPPGAPQGIDAGSHP